MTGAEEELTDAEDVVLVVLKVEETTGEPVVQMPTCGFQRKLGPKRPSQQASGFIVSPQEPAMTHF